MPYPRLEAFLMFPASALVSRTLRLSLAVTTILSLGPTTTAAGSVDNDLARFVDPFIGTGPSTAKDPVPGGSGGSVFPGAAVPFGMVQWSPDTPKAEPSGYGYNDVEIKSFSLTHYSGAGCANNGDLPILPTVGDENTTALVGFSHASETASPGYYGVTLANGVQVQLSATTRTGFGRFVFPGGHEAKNLLLDASRNNATNYGAQLTADGTYKISGYTNGGNFCGSGNHYTLYFAAQFDQPFTIAKSWLGGALLSFGHAANLPVQMKVGLSFVSVANARANLAAEAPGWDFGAVKSAARAQWNERLNHILVTGGGNEALTKFYTAFYHSLLHPNVASDVNGEAVGFDGKVFNAKTTKAGDHVGFTYYGNYSGWDIYRSQVQLLTMLFPNEASDIAQSLVTDAAQCGSLPKWSQNNGETGVMVGDPGTAIVASIYAFGGQTFDTQAALTTMIKSATRTDTRCNDVTIRPGLGPYLSYGYIPESTSGVWGSVSTTLEYQSADFALSQMAAAMGDTDTARALHNRSLGWRNLFDASTGLLRPRLTNGDWYPAAFGPATTQGFVEGNAAQYVWMVPHDAATLVTKLGGPENMVHRLDQLFTKLNGGILDPYFYMGNEPNFATPWLYPWARAPWRTQDTVRRIMDEAFTLGAGGLPGNDDLGATSSWYVWAALGLYPVAPGVGGLVVSTPTFADIRIITGRNAQLHISSNGAPSRYIQDMEIDGLPHHRAWLELTQIMGGASLTFNLGDQPSAWASGVGEQPPALAADVYPALPASFNSRAQCNDDATGAWLAVSLTAAGNFDGLGNCFSRRALQNAGIDSHGTFKYQGLTFHNLLPQGLDNTLVTGQTLLFKDPTPASALALLGAANHGPSRGEGTLIYADGSEQSFSLVFNDWSMTSSTGAVANGNETVLSMPYRLGAHGEHDKTAVHLYLAWVPLNPNKLVKAMRLPGFVNQGSMHLFGVELVNAKG